MNEFEQILDQWKQKQQQRRQKIINRAKPVLQSYVDRGVNQVEIQYSGSEDNGSVGEIILKPTEEIPEDEDYEILEELAYECLPPGWENNDGSEGKICIEISNDKCVLVINHYWLEPTYDESLGSTEFSLTE